MRPIRQINAKNAVVLGCVLISLTTVINSIGVRLMARIKAYRRDCRACGGDDPDRLTLALHVRRGPLVLLDTLGRREASRGGLPWFIPGRIAHGLICYARVRHGAHARGRNRPAPPPPLGEAILQALAAAGLAGALVMFFGILAVRATLQTSSSAGPAAGDCRYWSRTSWGANWASFFSSR